MMDLIIALIYSMGRMFLAYIVSVITALVLGVSMARNRYLEAVLLPILDILQSVPILGFLPVALLYIARLLPGMLGVEAAVVFLLTTSMVWNIIFGVYSSVKSLDPSIDDLVKTYRLGLATRFFTIYSQAGIKSIGANSLISWAGGWFFITSAEVMVGGEGKGVIGIGSEIIKSFTMGDYARFGIGLLILVISIVATYIFIWNPMASESTGIRLVNVGILYDEVFKPLARITWDGLAEACIWFESKLVTLVRSLAIPGRIVRGSAYGILAVLVALAMVNISRAVISYGGYLIRVSTTDVLVLISNTTITLARVATVVLISVVITVILAYASYLAIVYGEKSLGHQVIVLLGEILASIPAILWWPILSYIAFKGSIGQYIVAFIVFLQGTIWYSYFNILIFGLSSIGKELTELSRVYRIKGSLFLRTLFIPAMLPSVASGALSAWGGCWNSSIVAEYMALGTSIINLGGIGSLLDIYAAENDYTRLTLALIMLSIVIAIINIVFWRGVVFKKVSRRFTVV
jgi:NitT/TauT family transport system permease protein